MAAKLPVVDGLSFHGLDVGGDHRLPRRRFVPECGGEVDGWVCHQDRVDFAELDAESADLDLEVAAAQVFEGAVGAPAHQVARAVHPLAWFAERIGDKSVGGEVGTIVVSAGESGAGHVQLPDDSHRHGLEVPVEDQSGKADGRSSDVDVLARPHGFTDAGLDGGFGRSVSVEHATVAAPDVHEFGWAGLATDCEYAEFWQRGAFDRTERGRSDERV